MKNFEDLLKIVEEEFKELQIEELTRMMNEGQDSNFYIILFYHFQSIITCNIITEYVINSVMIIEYLVFSSSYFLHAC